MAMRAPVAARSSVAGRPLAAGVRALPLRAARPLVRLGLGRSCGGRLMGCYGRVAGSTLVALLSLIATVNLCKVAGPQPLGGGPAVSCRQRAVYQPRPHPLAWYRRCSHACWARRALPRPAATPWRPPSAPPRRPAARWWRQRPPQRAALSPPPRPRRPPRPPPRRPPSRACPPSTPCASSSSPTSRWATLWPLPPATPSCSSCSPRWARLHKLRGCSRHGL